MNLLIVFLAALPLFAASQAAAQTETHWHLQSVTTNGTSAWAGSHPFTLHGVILNDPEEMLDPTFNTNAVAQGVMGGQWQIFIQAVYTNDRGGTALWMGQNYGSLPWIPDDVFYDEAAWSNEMQRVNFDGNHRFRAGDLVEVTARMSLFFGGKRNVNEAHSTNTANDFSIHLLQAGYGLPDPEVITLADLVTSGTNQIFDATRQSGGELYQGMRVRLEGIRFTTNYFGTNGWGKTAWGQRRCTVTDGEGRFFTLRMPLKDLGPMPDDWFSATGILNQESGSGTDGRSGYELFVQEIGPTLRTFEAGGRLFVYWSGAYTNYTLEYTTNLALTGWTNVSAPRVKWLAVEEEMDAGARFYRLRKNP